jgi:ribosomal protein S1
VGQKVKGKVVNLVPYGAFVELEPGVEGLVHVTELSWTKRIGKPSDVLKQDQEVEAVVLGINREEQKISLGIRQLEANPWDRAQEKYPPGTRIKGKIRNLTSYGAFIELEEGLDGMIHVSDISWTRKINHPSEVLRRGTKSRRRCSRSIRPTSGSRWASNSFGRSVEQHRQVLQGRRSRHRQGHQAGQLRGVHRPAARHRRVGAHQPGE